MSSIIKVDTIQTAAGGVPTAADLGLNVTGNLIDAKYVSLTTTQNISSSSYADVTNASITVTPTSSSSKFLVVCVCQYYLKDNYTLWQAFRLRLVRDTTELINDQNYGVAMYNNPTNFFLMGKSSQAYLDSPATTSSITYKAQGALNNTNHTAVNINHYGIGHMYVLEIAG